LAQTSTVSKAKEGKKESKKEGKKEGLSAE
jgi:hypothetical protein